MTPVEIRPRQCGKAGNIPVSILDRFQSFLSFRFLKYCVVGVSGIVVNLVFLALFADLLDVQVNLASALAIEVSIVSNFIMNEIWTFRDRHKSSAGFSFRLLKFHLVALVGGGVQWGVFILGNYFWVWLLGAGSQAALPVVAGDTWWSNNPIVNPPDVGNLKYVSQLVGIGVAMFWNYSANFFWTWAKETREAKDG